MILILDNKDSFVWNLAQAFGALGQPVEVRRSDALSVAACGAYRALVLSPGPGRPEDAGICVQAVQAWSGRRPILGVCLGHQAIGHAFGARIVRSAPCHGRPSPVRHAGEGLYHGLPAPLSACRYHSLCVHPDDLGGELLADAWTEAGSGGQHGQPIVMGLRHRRHPTFGVQFHPESFRTPDGPALLRNFLREAG